MSIDLFIVGAGPAGMAAAIEARAAGLSVLVADEGAGPGGQIYRAIETADAASLDVLGAEYAAGRALAARFRAAGAQYLAQASVFLIEREGQGAFSVGISLPGGAARLVTAARILIATGAQERPFPIPGWTLPGVMTAGAAQTLLKAGAIVPEGPLVLAGTGPLLLLLAAQYARAGVPIALLLDTTDRSSLTAALPHLPGFLLSRNAWKGAGLLREALAHAPVRSGVTALAAEGTGQLEAVRYSWRGQEHLVQARTLLLHQGVAPQVNLALSAGVRHGWNAARLAFEPVLSPDGESSVAGLFIAGDSGGISGAEAAAESGLIAALAISRSLGALRPDDAARAAVARQALSRARRGREFLDRLFRPAGRFRKPDDAVVICRCEMVSAGDIRRLARRGAQGPNQMKAFSRAGMGPCQGRMCGLTVSDIMAETLGISPEAIGTMRIRTPVKPITVAQMAGLCVADAAATGEPPPSHA